MTLNSLGMFYKAHAADTSRRDLTRDPSGKTVGNKLGVVILGLGEIALAKMTKENIRV